VTRQSHLPRKTRAPDVRLAPIERGTKQSCINMTNFYWELFCVVKKNA